MERRRQGARMALAAVLGAAMLALMPGAAAAATTAPGVSAEAYATGFPESPAAHWGPIGIAFDRSDNLYVGDPVDGNIYRFEPGGGAASAATRLTTSPISGRIEGLAITRSGELFAARYDAGDVVQLDPDTGRVLRTVAQVPCALGLAVDPASGDLFVSQGFCGAAVWRISGVGTASPTATPYASAADADGLAFDTDGTLYASSAGTVLRIAGTGSATPGAATDVAQVPNADGLAFGAHGAGSAPFLVANRTDGIVTRVDFGSDGSAQQSDIFQGGSRGDFAAVDSHGCLYITQSDRVVRLAAAKGHPCGLQPTTAPAAGSATDAAVTVTVLATEPAPGSGPSARAPQGISRRTGARATCTPLTSLRVRVGQRGGVRLRSATIYLDGHAVRTLRGAAVTAPTVVGHLPRGPFTLTVVAVTTRGKRLTTRQSYLQCHAAPKPTPAARCPATSRLSLAVPQPRGGRAVRVDVLLNGRRVQTVRGRAVRRITLRSLPGGRATVTLLITSARGTRTKATRTVTGCPRGG